MQAVSGCAESKPASHLRKVRVASSLVSFALGVGGDGSLPHVQFGCTFRRKGNKWRIACGKKGPSIGLAVESDHLRYSRPGAAPRRYQTACEGQGLSFQGVRGGKASLRTVRTETHSQGSRPARQAQPCRKMQGGTTQHNESWAS